MAENDDRTMRRVCVIGAGAAGLCAARHIANLSNDFEFVVFEQTDDIGGTWVYNEKIGLDEHGYPIHSSMYENLRTNLPLKIMNFPDYATMESNEVACGSHRQVLNYLRDYADHFQLRPKIRFNTRVKSVRPVTDASGCNRTIWRVRVKNVITKLTEELDFDAAMICNGHYSEPNVPNIPGIETFSGDISHSHDYRKPDRYTDKRVVVLGAASSGIDISLELSGRASHVYLSHNNESFRFNDDFPNNVTQVSGVERVNGEEFVFRDGTKIMADSFIYCTGYKYVFPFLDEDCEVRVDDNHVTPLYKHLINVQHPSMSIIGIPSTVIPFALFHMQVQYHLAVLMGRATLPEKAKMLIDSTVETSKKRHAHVLASKQFDYNDDLATSGGFERLPDYYRNGYTSWSAFRMGNLLGYRNSKFFVAEDGTTVTIVPSTQRISQSTTS